MNTQVLLTEQQETSRIQEGLKLYNSAQIEQIDSRNYLVKGKYIVEDLTTNDDPEPYYRCACADHTYRGVECKHILAVTFLQLNQVRIGA